MTMDFDLMPFDEQATITNLLSRYRHGALSVREVTAFCLERIERYNTELRAVLAVNPNALARADALDQSADKSAPLFGVPMLIKDNIETATSPLPRVRRRLPAHRQAATHRS